MGKLDGKTALITGASKGIGEGIARTFVKHGARVVLAAQLRAEGAQAVAVRMDVSDMDSVRAGYEAGVKEFGQIDILVSNAGICRLGDFLTQSDSDRDAHLDINVKGAWNTCKAVLPGMVERKWGRIVIMSSVTGDMVAAIPLGRLADPREVGELAAFLSSDEASYLTGAQFVIDGGSTLPETSTMGV